ncbi:MAG TPA: ABC transporter substrate-binding protein [Dehalococcoidia bacterium]|jgi:ABC-type transport system substrate-binding protein|nr:ABC transporter substrate-binding protein [Dehalococcoidia bacterium]
MQDSYWSTVLRRRIGRRRAIVATAGAGAAAAFLAACGGSDNNNSSSNTGGGSGSTGAKSDLLTPIEDTSKSAKRGGVMKWTQASEPLHFDGQAQGQAQLNIYNGMVYESLVRNKPGIGEASTFTEVLPNLAESWEFSPDKTTLTFKLRSDVKWQNVAPVSGRAFDANDVAASWTRYVGLPNNNKAANANSVNASAPIISVTATDPKTVVYKLKEPTSFIMQRIANMITGEVGSIYPKETDQGFDARKGQIGTGGLMLENYVPSASLTYKRNPDYWNKDAVFPDTLEMPIINEPAAKLAQFQTGAIYAVGGLADISPEDIVPTKRGTPVLDMYSFIAPSNNVSYIQRFGWQNLNGKAPPWLDVRVRQAMAMAIDRDSYIDAFSNISNFEKEGLPAEPLYHTSMGYIPGVTLDPTSKDFGENAKYYTHNLEEAKKLMSAAGYASGFEYPSHWPNFPLFGPNFPKQIAVIEGFNQELGLKPASDPIDYNLSYLPNYVTKRGQHEGIVFTLGAVTSPDPTDYFVWRYYSKSGATSGAIFGDIGSGAGEGDPKVDDFIDKAKAELDASKQKTILADLQKYLAGMQYAVTSPGLGTQFTLAWPAVKNYLTFQGDSRAINSFYYTWWLDDTKAPIKRT